MRRILALLLLLLPSLSLAQKAKPDPKSEPRVLYAMPFGLAPGKAATLTLRGRNLETATAVQVLPRGVARLLRKGKSAVPNKQNPDRVGDSEAQVELTVPADTPGSSVRLSLTTSAGTSPAHEVLLDRTPPLAEKEPNDGFKQAQPVPLGQVVEGSIGQNQDVDVFRFEGKAGQKVVLEVLAARHGGPLDAILTLYDAAGQVIASKDDSADSTDPVIEATLPRDGVYYASISDAHDQGGATHRYRFVVRAR